MLSLPPVVIGALLSALSTSPPWLKGHTPPGGPQSPSCLRGALCHYACWERRVAQNSSCCGSFCFHFFWRVSWFPFWPLFFPTIAPAETSRSSVLSAVSAGRKSHAAFLPVTPLAGSSVIACQSGLILFKINGSWQVLHQWTETPEGTCHGEPDHSASPTFHSSSILARMNYTSSILSHWFVQIKLPKR